MAIISQDTIKLGCSGSQGKIQIQTFFEHTAQLVQQMSRILYKLACFFAKQSQFQKSQMDIRLIITRDYEKKLHWTLGENKPKQSQSLITLVSLNWLCIISFYVILT